MKPEVKAYFEAWQVSRFWAISRFKGKTNRGSCYPLRIIWDAPVGRKRTKKVVLKPAPAALNLELKLG